MAPPVLLVGACIKTCPPAVSLWEVDELNSVLGLARLHCQDSDRLQALDSQLPDSK